MEKVLILVEAEIMDGENIESVNRVDVINCNNSRIVKKSILSDNLKRKDYVDNALNIMSAATGISKEKIISKSRKHPLPHIRFSIANYLYKTGAFSLGQVGEVIGRRDHTTVIHALNQHKNLTETNDEKYLQYSNILNQ